MASSSSLIHARTGKKVRFQYNPEAIRDTKDSVIKGVQAAGLDMPRIIAAQGGGRDINFALTFAANGTDYTEERIVEAIAAIRAMSSPEVVSLSPRVVRLTPALLIIGNFLELPVIVKRSAVRWFDFNNETDAMPVRATVELSLVTVPGDQYMDAAAVRDGGMTKRAYSFSSNQPRRIV